jgi:hypothetical protein
MILRRMNSRAIDAAAMTTPIPSARQGGPPPNPHRRTQHIQTTAEDSSDHGDPHRKMATGATSPAASESIENKWGGDVKDMTDIKDS